MGLGYRNRVLLVAVTALVAFLASQAAWSAGRFKLKPGAVGKSCAPCHPDIEDKLKKPFVHTPVKEGECQGCHNPHASSFGKLLEADPNRICVKCHEAILPAQAKSTHDVVLKGAGVKCHDPHAAANKGNLLKAGNALCFDCHKELGEKVAKAKFGHDPVKESCLTCHNPHASAKAASLLTEAVPALCVGCHDTGGQEFLKRHGGYPVAKAQCSSCHDPHGSDTGGLLLGNFHKPVANRQCNLCHEPASSAKPFATKRKGIELCRGCHAKMVNETFAKKRVHAALLNEGACGACHTPHASKEKLLLRDTPLNLCGDCHADAVERTRKSPTPHAPITEGKCIACHLPHSSDTTYLLPLADEKEVCGKCHEWMKHSTHPIGDKILDPRNRNLTVQCRSCHRTHGTEFKHLFYYATVSETCVQCHAKYQR